MTRSFCPICGGPRRALPGSCPDAWLCIRCAHTFVGVLPSSAEIAAAYEKYNYDDSDARKKEVPTYLDDILTGIVKSFEPHRATGRLLDVGFGDGGFLRIARRLGWEPHGVEFSEDAVRAACARGLGNLHAGDFRDVPLTPASFDVVVMSEVIEHVTDPGASLRRAAEVLRPGGLLYLTTPHGRGVSGRLLEGSWSVLCPPEHLQLFSIASMRRSLLDAGFAKMHIHTQGILPHELVTTLRARVRLAATTPPPAPDRVGKTHDLNAKFESGALGRVVKRSANRVLQLMRAGDSLRARAVR